MIEVTRHDDVLRLRGSTRASRAIDYEVSAYVVRGVLVDALFPAVGDEFAAWLRVNRLDGALVTHHHEDHAGNVDRLVAAGTPVGMAPATLERVRRPAAIGAYRRVCWHRAAPLPRDPEPFAAAGLELVPTPGHTPDHHVVWDPTTGTVFGGDLFIGVKVRVAHPGEDVRGQPEQLRRIAALHPRRYFDAHRGPVEQPVERLLAKAQWIDDTVGAIERLADEGRDARTIERTVLGPRDLTDWVSRGDYARANVVASVLSSRAERAAAGGGPTVGARAQ